MKYPLSLPLFSLAGHLCCVRKTLSLHCTAMATHICTSWPLTIWTASTQNYLLGLGMPCAVEDVDRGFHHRSYPAITLVSKSLIIEQVRNGNILRWKGNCQRNKSEKQILTTRHASLIAKRPGQPFSLTILPQLPHLLPQRTDRTVIQTVDAFCNLQHCSLGRPVWCTTHDVQRIARLVNGTCFIQEQKWGAH